MKLEIKKANRTDLKDILMFTYKNVPVIDEALITEFDEILSQTGHTVFLAKADERIVGTLCVSIINGIGKKYPVAVLSGGKLFEFERKNEVAKALLESASAIARQYGCGVCLRQINS